MPVMEQHPDALNHEGWVDLAPGTDQWAIVAAERVFAVVDAPYAGLPMPGSTVHLRTGTSLQVSASAGQVMAILCEWYGSRGDPAEPSVPWTSEELRARGWWNVGTARKAAWLNSLGVAVTAVQTSTPERKLPREYYTHAQLAQVTLFCEVDGRPGPVRCQVFAHDTTPGEIIQRLREANAWWTARDAESRLTLPGKEAGKEATP